MLHPSETLRSSVLELNVFHQLCPSCLLTVVIWFVLDALGSISHSQANVNKSYFLLDLFLKVGIDELLDHSSPLAPNSPPDVLTLPKLHCGPTLTHLCLFIITPTSS